MRRSIPAASILAASMFATACVTVSKSVLMDRSFAPVPLRDVYVFLPEDETPEDCERVALLSASGEVDWTDESEMIDKMREEAGKLGANAILIRSIEDPGTGERVVAALFDTEADRDGSAIALWCPSRGGEGRPGR